MEKPEGNPVGELLFFAWRIVCRLIALWALVMSVVFGIARVSAVADLFQRLSRFCGAISMGAGRRNTVAETAETIETVPAEEKEGYSVLLQKIRQVNDRIADEELSAKIDRLEEITARIMRTVDEDPQKKERMDTFFDYYLPTTQKLLDSYAEFEAAGVEGENICQAKQRITDIMDSIIRGFERQLDQLYKADAMDVESDIRVMETMLKRDTARVSDDFDIGGTAVQTLEQ